MNNSAKSRFHEVMDLLGLTDYRVYTDIKEISKNMMVKLRNGDTEEVSIKILIPFCMEYNKVNPEYILTGRGTPLKENALNAESIPEVEATVIATEDSYKQAVEKGLHLLPEVDFKFAAGQVSLLNGTEDITRYWYLPDCKDCEGVAQVVGNSMIPALPSGCWVALKKHFFDINRTNQIPFGNVFGVVVEDPETGEYHGHIKILRKYRDDKEKAKKYWIARSINDKEFDDFDIEISQVRSLWIVKQHIVSDILL